MNLQPEFSLLNFFNLYMFKSAVEKYNESNVFFKKKSETKNLNGATSCDVNDKDKQK